MISTRNTQPIQRERVQRAIYALRSTIRPGSFFDKVEYEIRRYAQMVMPDTESQAPWNTDLFSACKQAAHADRAGLTHDDLRLPPTHQFVAARYLNTNETLMRGTLQLLNQMNASAIADIPNEHRLQRLNPLLASSLATSPQLPTAREVEEIVDDDDEDDDDDVHFLGSRPLLQSSPAPAATAFTPAGAAAAVVSITTPPAIQTAADEIDSSPDPNIVTFVSSHSTAPFEINFVPRPGVLRRDLEYDYSKVDKYPMRPFINNPRHRAFATPVETRVPAGTDPYTADGLRHRRRELSERGMMRVRFEDPEIVGYRRPPPGLPGSMVADLLWETKQKAISSRSKEREFDFIMAVDKELDAEDENKLWERA
jgi:hypothetical protein